MMTLTEFLLARIAEDETNDTTLVGVARKDWTVRWLAECAAKRQIVHLHSGPDYWKSPDFHLCVDSMTNNDECDTLHALAMPYADHPDYRPEWKP